MSDHRSIFAILLDDYQTTRVCANALDARWASRNNYCNLDMDRCSQIYLAHGGVDDVLGGRQNADPSPASNATSARTLVVPLVYEPHVTDRPGRTETTFPNHGDAMFQIQRC
jgi:hypothetical protein